MTTDGNLQALLEEIKELEKAILDQLKENQSASSYQIKNKVITFEKESIKSHKGIRKKIRSHLWETSLMDYLVAPVLFSMVIPAVILDLFACLYQTFCFPVYGIPKITRRDYISFDRRKLPYLNWIEKMGCDYCAYVNGVIAFARELASRTEQYYCPIRHALRTKGLHPRHAQFIPYGETTNFRAKLIKLRKEVCSLKKEE